MSKSKKSATEEVLRAPMFPGKESLLLMAQKQDAGQTKIALTVTVLDYKPNWKKLYVSASLATIGAMLEMFFSCNSDNLGVLRTIFTTPFMDSPNDEEIHFRISTAALQKKRPELTEVFVPGAVLSVMVEGSAYAGSELNGKIYNGFYVSVLDVVN